MGKINSIIIYWTKLYACLILFGFVLRKITCVYFYNVLLNDTSIIFFKLLLYGFMFDSCVFSVLFLMFISVAYFFKNQRTFLKHFFISNICIFYFFDAINFIHIIYFGVGINQNSIDLFDLNILKKIASSQVFCLFILSVAMLYYSLHLYFKIVFNIKHLNTIKDLIFSYVLIFAISFFYMPFPLFYNASFSSSSIINELSKNGIYNYSSSLYSYLTISNTIRDVENIKLNEALKTLSSNTSHVVAINDEKLIRAVFQTKKYKHIILIVMESMGSNAMNDSVSPNLIRLTKESLYFSNCKAVGPRTQIAMSTLLTGIPNVIGTNYYRRKGIYKIETLADCMALQNYESFYLHNGYLKFDDMYGFLKQGGFTAMLDANDITHFSISNNWGKDDESLFKLALKHIGNNRDKNTLHVLQSITNHEPFTVPKQFINQHLKIKNWNKKFQTYFYADAMLEYFIKELTKQTHLDSTIIYITGDHGEVYSNSDFSYKIFQVPLFIISNDHKPQKIDYDCTHADIPYTILGNIGYNKHTVMLGENLFDLKKSRAIISTNYNLIMNVKRNDTLLRYNFENNKEELFLLNNNDVLFEINDSTKSINLKKIALSYYKMLREYLLQGKINN